jgi:hypothetical protein
MGWALYSSPFTKIPEFIFGMITGIMFILNSSDDNQSNADVTTSLISSNENQQYNRFSLSLRNFCWNYKYSHILLDIFFISQIYFYIAIHSPPLPLLPIPAQYYDILTHGALTTFIICIDLYFYAKFPSSLTAKLLTTSVFLQMGVISYAFYCLVEALPDLSLLLTDEFEHSALMRLWGGIGIAVFAHHYIEAPLYKWADKKLPRCDCM